MHEPSLHLCPEVVLGLFQHSQVALLLSLLFFHVGAVLNLFPDQCGLGVAAIFFLFYPFFLEATGCDVPPVSSSQGSHDNADSTQ